MRRFRCTDVCAAGRRGCDRRASGAPPGVRRTEGAVVAMKILVYAHRLEIGGTQVNAIELAAALRDNHGFDVVFFAQPGPMVSLVHEKRLRYVPAPDARYHPSFARMRALRELVHRERPDLVHAWDWWQCLDAYYAVHLPNRLPMVVSDMMMEPTRLLPRHVPTTFGVPALAALRRARRPARDSSGAARRCGGERPGCRRSPGIPGMLANRSGRDLARHRVPNLRANEGRKSDSLDRGRDGPGRHAARSPRDSRRRQYPRSGAGAGVETNANSGGKRSRLRVPCSIPDLHMPRPTS